MDGDRVLWYCWSLASFFGSNLRSLWTIQQPELPIWPSVSYVTPMLKLVGWIAFWSCRLWSRHLLVQKHPLLLLSTVSRVRELHGESLVGSRLAFSQLSPPTFLSHSSFAVEVSAWPTNVGILLASNDKLGNKPNKRWPITAVPISVHKWARYGDGIEDQPCPPWRHVRYPSSWMLV